MSIAAVSSTGQVRPGRLRAMAPPGSKGSAPPLDQTTLSSTICPADAPSPRHSGLARWAVPALSVLALGATAAAAPPQFVAAQQGEQISTRQTPSVAEARSTDGPTAAEVRGYYREISSRVAEATTRFQTQTSELAQYRVLDFSGGDFEVVQKAGDGTRVTYSSQGLRLDTPSGSYTRSRSGEFVVRRERQGFTEEIRQEKSGKIHYSASTLDGRFGFRESYEQPEVTLAIYPAPVLNYRFEPFRGTNTLGSREVTIQQDGSSRIRLEAKDSPPEVSFEAGWSQD